MDKYLKITYEKKNMNSLSRLVYVLNRSRYVMMFLLAAKNRWQHFDWLVIVRLQNKFHTNLEKCHATNMT